MINTSRILGPTHNWLSTALSERARRNSFTLQREADQKFGPFLQHLLPRFSRRLALPAERRLRDMISRGLLISLGRLDKELGND